MATHGAPNQGHDDAPYEPSFAELRRRQAQAEWNAVPPILREIAEEVSLLTDLYHFDDKEDWLHGKRGS